MKKNIILTSFIAISATACATPSYNYVPEVEYLSEPEVGIVTTVSVGDKMLTQGNLLYQDGFRLSAPFKIGTYALQPGFYKKTGEKEDYSFFSPAATQVKSSVFSDPFQTVAVSSDLKKLCAVSIYNIRNCKDAPSIQMEEIVVESPSSFQQTLLYNGRVGDKINIGYREFSGSTARPAFNNEVEYDLSEDSSFAYKGAEIEVLQADNRQIKYKVITNFRQPN